MSEEALLVKLKDSIVNLDVEAVKKTCKDTLRLGISPHRIMLEGISKGMDIVGVKFESEEYFLSHLILASDAVGEALAMLKPCLHSESINPIGKVVLGTIQGDVHSIGKDIFKLFLEASGFEVFDLGIDVSPEKFVKSVREVKPDIVGISTLLTVTMRGMEATVKMLQSHDLRENIKVIIGGPPTSSEYVEKIGADAAAVDAHEGVTICRQWVEKAP